MNIKINKNNNFNLVRFLAALQVVIWHSSEHLLTGQWQSTILNILRPFLGVPIFFVISGFLIYSSFERNNSLRKYFRNRCLRIFPGLWSVFVLTFTMLCILGYILPNMANNQLWYWVLTQVSIFQFYTPEFLKPFGVGNPNGSLWTIFIEFSFYLFVPVLFLFKQIKARSIVIILLFVGSVWFNFWYNNGIRSKENVSVFEKLLGMNLLLYLFYFLAGVIMKVYWEKIKNLFINKEIYWVIGYLAYYLIFSIFLEVYQISYWPNLYGLISTCILLAMTISIAYSFQGLGSFLQGVDVSYGLYLYHMPLVNLFIANGYVHNPIYVFWIATITLLVSYLSWVFIEKPALKLK